MTNTIKRAISCHKSIYNQAMLDWHIPSDDRHRFERFYILHWNPTYLFSEWKEYSPIVREGITYLRVYHQCHMREIKNAKVALMSFRKLPDMKYGTVLISPARVNSSYGGPKTDFASQLPAAKS